MANRKNLARARLQRWRAKVPELQEIVEHVAPATYELGTQTQKNLPKEWECLVAGMRETVRKKATDATWHGETTSFEQRKGYHWSFMLERVSHMVEHLTKIVLEDIGLPPGATLPSIALLAKALLHVQLELQDGGTKGGREDRLENRHRVQEALKRLSPYFDEVQMRRLRALQVIDWAPRLTRVRTEQEIEHCLADIAGSEALFGGDVEKHRAWMEVEQPVMMGLFVRHELAEVDARFGELDPLVVLEECSEATASAEGGKAEGGEGRIGATRALARLAVMCRALSFEQREDEEFDTAVERARGNLLVTRSRIKKAIDEFPLGSAEEALPL